MAFANTLRETLNELDWSLLMSMQTINIQAASCRAIPNSNLLPKIFGVAFGVRIRISKRMGF